MKYALWIFLSLYATAMVVACGKSTNNNGNSGAYAPANGGCPAGTVFMNGSCYNGNQIVSSGTGFKSDNYRQRTLTVANSGVYQSFLKEAMGTCDRGGYSAGSAACSAYASGYVQLTIQSVQQNYIRLTIEAQPQQYNNYNYYVSLPTAGQAATCGITYLLTGYCYSYPTAYSNAPLRNPLALDMVVSAINNSKGFEARSYGASGTVSQNSLIQFQVATGQLSDGSFNYQLAYKGQSGGVFMNGTMQRCTDASCGFYYY